MLRVDADGGEQPSQQVRWSGVEIDPRGLRSKGDCYAGAPDAQIEGPVRRPGWVWNGEFPKDRHLDPGLNGGLRLHAIVRDMRPVDGV